MSVKLRSRTQSPPNGFLWEEKATGWKNWIAAPHTVWDFATLARELQAHRRANKARFPWLSIDYATIEKQLDEANALRVSKIAGAESYLMNTEAPSPPKTGALPLPNPAVAVGGLAKINAGRKMLLDWEKDGFPQAPQEQANSRAATCAECSKNEKGDWTRWFTVPASNMIKGQIERLKEIKLETPSDDKLKCCTICLCPLQVKVHTPTDYVAKYLLPEIKAELSEVRTNYGKRCWVTEEIP